MPASAAVRMEPFPHSTAIGALAAPLADAALNWMETCAPWRLRIASFYEQWELHLSPESLPKELLGLLGAGFIAKIVQTMLVPLSCGSVELIEATAHRLLPGQTIKLHNDYREGGETHRVLIQLNRDWKDQNGGLLMLFGSERATDVARVIRPLHRTAFGFRISERSFHAVSTISQGDRFTLVFSFRAVETSDRCMP